jgi:hypothetical protein
MYGSGESGSRRQLPTHDANGDATPVGVPACQSECKHAAFPRPPRELQDFHVPQI